MTDRRTEQGALGLAVGALGVVYGDIGTSPLYALRTMLHTANRPDHDVIYGLTSTAVWSLILVVSVLYIGMLTRLDHDGEGGLLALLTLVRARARGRLRWIAMIVGMLGAALFLGDSVVTPAISVLSASEGVGVASPGLSRFALPAASLILVGVFVLQHVGSGRIGSIYGPIMVLWFLTLGVTGAAAIAQHPQALTMLSPTWAFHYFQSDPGTAFLALGSVVLTITGAEALYADLGHFGRRAIAQSWFLLVFPALIIGYVGEAATVAHHPGDAAQPFYAVVPSWGTIPVLLLATLATIIASEATIAGAFTVLHQAGGLELLPQMRTRHPSEQSGGRVYLPAANWGLGVVVVAVVLGFGSSSALASAYGVAVSATILTTVTLATMYAALRRERARLIGTVALGLVALAFATATVPKIATGGWLPVAIAIALFATMTTWHRGRARLRAQRREAEPPTSELVKRIEDGVDRRCGSAVFLNDDKRYAPLALVFMLDHEHALAEHTVVLSWQVDESPTSPPHEEAVSAHPLAPGVVAVHMVLGYRDRLEPARLLRYAVERHEELLEGFDPDRAIFYISQEIPRMAAGGDLARWRQRLFVAIARIAFDRAEDLTTPRDRTVVIGREFAL